jgi:hypothetical protein
MNIKILDVVRLFTFFRDSHVPIYKDFITSHYSADSADTQAWNLSFTG